MQTEGEVSGSPLLCRVCSLLRAGTVTASGRVGLGWMGCGVETGWGGESSATGDGVTAGARDPRGGEEEGSVKYGDGCCHLRR